MSESSTREEGRWGMWELDSNVLLRRSGEGECEILGEGGDARPNRSDASPVV